MLHDKKMSPLQISKTGLIRMRTMAPMSRRTFSLGALTAGAAAVTGVGSASAGTGVKYHGWQGYDDATNAGSFLDNIDVVLEPTYINSNEEIIATARSGGIGHMDLCTPVNFMVPLYTKSNLLEPLDTDRIPNLQGVFPEFLETPGLVVDGVRYAVPFTWGSIPLMWNAEVITEPPTSWWDLFKPEYKGKTAATEDLFGLMPPFAYTATGTKTATRLTREELDKTVDLLIKFKKEHALTIAAGYGDLAALFASGEVIIAPGWEPMSIWAGPDAPKLAWAVPKEGTISFVDNYAMIKDAPHRELNHEIMNHVLSPDAQALTSELNSTAVTVADAVPLLSDAVRTIYPYDDLASYFERAGGMTVMYPLEPEGDFVTYEDVLDGWEKFLKE